jgi:Xaa-Pro aminopeptidase
MSRSFASRTRLSRLLSRGALIASAVLLAASYAAAQGNDARPTGPRSQLDLPAVQGMLSIQEIDGWLLYDNTGQNPIASGLINPVGEPTRRWFYFIPAEGEPTALVHKVDAGRFEHVPGRKLVYTGQRDLDKHLGVMLGKSRRVAMEYSRKAELPALSRVDAGTLEMVRTRRRKIVSSADLVQVANAVWGPEGRVAHYVAAHHLTRLRQSALLYVADKVRRGENVTERDVQTFLLRGYEMRGLVGPPPVVATGAHTANPSYTPTVASAAPIARGHLLLIEMRARLAGAERPIYAETTWVAYVGDSVPDRYAEVFSVVVRARDAAVELVKDRLGRRRPVRGFEVDRQARQVIDQAGYKDQFVHRTGYSLDTTAHSAGANLDDLETRDTRTLVTGAGFAIEPGIYLDGEFGVRSGVNIHVTRTGVEVTMPAQTQITAVLAR